MWPEPWPFPPKLLQVIKEVIREERRNPVEAAYACAVGAKKIAIYGHIPDREEESPEVEERRFVSKLRMLVADPKARASYRKSAVRKGLTWPDQMTFPRW